MWGKKNHACGAFAPQSGAKMNTEFIVYSKIVITEKAKTGRNFCIFFTKTIFKVKDRNKFVRFHSC